MEKERKRKRRTFSAEYKAETVRLVQRSGKSMGQMALELGSDALRRWVAQAEIGSGTRIRRGAQAQRAGRAGGAAA